MSDREKLRQAFLQEVGWADAERRPISSDASFRRYERLSKSRQSRILMDAPPPRENVRPFLQIGDILAGYGLSAPHVFEQNVDHGFLLLEDFGDDSFTQRLSQTDAETDLYAAATDVLIDLHRNRQVPEGVLLYDEQALLGEADWFIDWYLPAFTGKPTPAPTRQDYHQRWRAVFSHLDGLDPVLVLRDYHADNLMWLPDRKATRRVGLLDFQDAVIGSPAYDLSSMLEDIRRDVPREVAQAMLSKYILAMNVDATKFKAAYRVLTAQRNTKIVGLWPRLWKRDGKPQYLRYMDRTWKVLGAALEDPILAPVADWFDRHVPAERRFDPLPGQPA